MGQKSFREPTTAAHLKKLADCTGITSRIFESPAVYTTRGLFAENCRGFGGSETQFAVLLEEDSVDLTIQR